MRKYPSEADAKELPKTSWFHRNKVALPASALLLAQLGAACVGTYDENEASTGSSALVSPVTVEFQQGVLPSSTYAGADDTTIAQANPTTNYGTSTTCLVDGDDGAGVDLSCLLKWNLSGIPAGSTVQSVSVTFRITDATSNTYSLYELKRAFSESQATWQRATSSVNWSTPGALASTDRGSVIGSITGSRGARTVSLNAAGVAMVQGWMDGAANNGFIIANSSNTNGLDVASSENATTSYRPKLSITYLPPATGGTGGASGTGGAGGTGGIALTGGAGGTGGIAAAGGTPATGGNGGTSAVPNLLVAFIGDQGANGNSDAVLRLIQREGAAATIHNGDFDYASNPAAWDSRITGILGANYPYFAIVGNHDAPAWSGTNGYASFIAARHARVPEMQCTGELGVKANCYFRGLHMVQSCVGTSELRSTCGKDSTDQVNFIRDSLAQDSSVWSMCNWHKNQADMQVGGKTDEVGWNAYRECMNAGAMVSTGHEHSYSRTLTLTDVGNVASGHGKTGAFGTLELGSGRNFVVVSGLAGVGVRDYIAASHDDDTWWASYSTANRWVRDGVLQTGTGTYGALFVRFHVDGDPKKASGYFKDVNDRIVDQFVIQRQ